MFLPFAAHETEQKLNETQRQLSIEEDALEAKVLEAIESTLQSIHRPGESFQKDFTLEILRLFSSLDYVFSTSYNKFCENKVYTTDLEFVVFLHDAFEKGLEIASHLSRTLK